MNLAASDTADADVSMEGHDHGDDIAWPALSGILNPESEPAPPADA